MVWAIPPRSLHTTLTSDRQANKRRSANQGTLGWGDQGILIWARVLDAASCIFFFSWGWHVWDRSVTDWQGRKWDTTPRLAMVAGIKRTELVSDWWIFSAWTDCCLAWDFVQMCELDWSGGIWIILSLVAAISSYMIIPLQQSPNFERP